MVACTILVIFDSVRCCGKRWWNHHSAVVCGSLWGMPINIYFQLWYI